MPVTPVGGLHHVTAIAGPAQENLDFYAGVLGMRLVKKSVNQDDPGHLSPVLRRRRRPSRHRPHVLPVVAHGAAARGHGLSVEVSLTVPPEASSSGASGSTRYGVRQDPSKSRFGARPSAAGGSARPARRACRSAGRVDADVRPVGRQPDSRRAPGARPRKRAALGAQPRAVGVVSDRRAGIPPHRHRGRLAPLRRRRGGTGEYIDVREVPGDTRRGAWGVGSIHHLAWRVADEAEQLAVRAAVDGAGRRPTPVIDRFWFKSVYFLEPGGVLFELATDGPGFAVDEDPKHLGESLVLPPWLESQRARRCGTPSVVAGFPRADGAHAPAREHVGTHDRFREPSLPLRNSDAADEATARRCLTPPGRVACARPARGRTCQARHTRTSARMPRAVVRPHAAGFVHGGADRAPRPVPRRDAWRHRRSPGPRSTRWGLRQARRRHGTRSRASPSIPGSPARDRSPGVYSTKPSWSASP